jgi:hypothetical protein
MRRTDMPGSTRARKQSIKQASKQGKKKQSQV